MISAHLEAEFVGAVDRVRQPNLNGLRAMGAIPGAIAKRNLSGPTFEIMNAKPERDGLYQPGDGPLYVAMAAYKGGSLFGLIAWRSDEPTRWWRRTGLGWLGNAEVCIATRWDGDRLMFHLTQHDALRAGEIGAWHVGRVVLDFDATDLSALGCFAAITCGTDWLAVTLRRALAQQAQMVPKGEAPDVLARRDRLGPPVDPCQAVRRAGGCHSGGGAG